MEGWDWGFPLWDSVNFAVGVAYGRGFQPLGLAEPGCIVIALPGTPSATRTL